MVRRGSGPVYVFDTSAWIECNDRAGDNRIPILLEQLYAARRIVSPKEVFGELEKPGEISDWARQRRRRLIAPQGLPSQYASNIGLVQYRFPAMGKAFSPKRRADPYVVGLSLTFDTPEERWIVVTGESLSRRPRRKIPGACKELDLDCMTIEDVIARELPDGGQTEEDYEPI